MRKFINFLIKREQCRTGSGFAECEKSRLKAKLTLTLALLLTAVGGAWAQSSLKVVEFDVPAAWEGEESYVTAGDLPGFKTSTLAEAQAWKGAPAEGMAMLIYAFDGDNMYFVSFTDGQYSTDENATMSKNVAFGQKSFIKIYYTAEPTEWLLTPDADKKVWTLYKMPASNIELQVEYEPTKVTMDANDKKMGTVEVAAGSKVEWTADTWKGWTYNDKEYTVDDITMTSSKEAYIYEYTDEGMYKNSLSFFVRKMVDDATVTFSTTGDPFSRIEFTMIEDYSDDWNPSIIPNDNWTFKGKSAVWEGEATKSLTLQSCSTFVSKITFYKGAAIPAGVTVNGDGTFTVAKTATVTLKATPKEGYKFLYWDDDPTNTNPVREVTIESGMADKTYKAVFAEITYNVTFVEGTDLNEWSATPATEVKKGDKVNIEYTGAKKVIGVKVEKKVAEPVADIIWDGTNVTDLNVESTYKSYTKEGVKLSGNADQVQVKWNNSEYLGKSGMEFITMESGGFTFTAPTGKKFTKIEMKALGSSGWAQVNLGTGWAYNTGTVTWNGSAASTVKLLKDADMFSGDFISSIAFYLSE